MAQSPIIQLNQKAFSQLLGFVQAAEGFTIGFLEVNFKHDLETILEALQGQSISSQIQWVVLDLPQPELRFLRDELVTKLAQFEPIPDKKRVILVSGLEQSIGMTGDYPPMLQDLNFVRDDYIKSVPHPLIFCLPDYAITRLAKYAPDFWAWKSGLFRFQTSESTKQQALEMTLESDRIRESHNLEESQERIDLLQRLLMESQPSGHNSSESELKNQFRLLNELGVLYQKLGEVEKSKNCFQKVLSSIPESEDFDSIKAYTLHCFGWLLDDQGKVDDAIALYKQSLEISEKIGNIQGKAITVASMAQLKVQSGNIDEAIQDFKSSIAILNQLQSPIAQQVQDTLDQVLTLKP